MIADLHNHYPMHLVPETHGDVLRLIRSARGRWRLLDRVQKQLVGAASRFANYESFHSGPRSTIAQLREGGIGVALSVLYSAYCEIDASTRHHHPPSDAYLRTILGRIGVVEEEIASNHSGRARVARNPAELDAALEAGEVAILHCLEGGFHLGLSPESVDRAVTMLAERGFAYVTVAHLFWRRVATHANAIPFLPDRLFFLLFPQPDAGLSELGRAAVRAMVRERVLVDISHMSERSIDDTFALLDELDPERAVPVIATHSGYRFGGQEYNLSERTVERIAERDGVIGLILAEHQLTDGLREERTATIADSLDVVFRHVDRLHEITGSHRHTAIGSDLDGFIKPTLAGFESSGDLRHLEERLRRRYGDGDGELIASGNALRLLRSYWRGAAPGSVELDGGEQRRWR